MENDVGQIRGQLDELLRIKEQFVGGTKLAAGFAAIVTASAGFAYVVIQLLRAALHGL